jgi:hypothetical protein
MQPRQQQPLPRDAKLYTRDVVKVEALGHPRVRQHRKYSGLA